MKKIAWFILSALLLLGCDDHIKVYYEKPVTGRSAARLLGTYEAPIEESDSTQEYSALSFARLAKKEYAIILHDKQVGKELETDTLYQGEIVRRGHDYFMNMPVEDQPGYWQIRSFRWKGDSVYHLAEALTGSQNEVFFQEKYFAEYTERQGESEEDTLYFVHNRMRETIRAFRTYHDATEEDILYLPKLSESEQQSFEQQIAPVSGPVKAYPNPFRSALTVQSDLEGMSQYQLVDLSGRIVKEKWGDVASFEWELDGVAPGIYILRIFSESGALQQSIKLSKQ